MWVDVHELLTELSDDEVSEMDRYAPRPSMSTYRIKRAKGTMGTRFLVGIEDKLDLDTEIPRYHSGRWLHE